MQRLRKIHKARPKKGWWKNKLLWETIGAGIAGSIVFYNLFFHPTLQIKEVKVEGAEKTAPAEIQQYIFSKSGRAIGFIKTQSIFFVPVREMQEGLLRDFPQFATVSIKRGLPDTLVVTVQERKAVAVWCTQDGSTSSPLGQTCFLIDQEGVVFEETNREGTEFLLLRDAARQTAPHLGEQVISKELLEQIFALAAELKNIQIEAKETTLASQERINIKTAEGWEIYFALPLDISWQITRLKLVLEKEIPAEKRQGLEYIDLRFSKVYYKYYSGI